MICFLHTPTNREPILPANLGLERPQLEIPNELRGQVNPNDLTETNTGLLVPGSRRDQLVSASRQVLVPESARMDRNRILTPDDEAIQQFGTQSTEEEKPQRPIREILVLGSNPRAFVIQEVLKDYGVHTAKELPSVVGEVLIDLDPEEKGEPSFSATQREERTKYQGRDGYTYTVPGPLEYVGMKITEAVADPAIREALGDSKGAEQLTLILKELLKKYRLKTPEKVEFLPEMPDLVNQLITALDMASLNRKLRFMIYDCLEQIDIPTSTLEDVLWRMDSNRDLSHPLSFQLTTEIMTHPQAAESTWLKAQEERRIELLGLLNNDPTTLVHHYSELKRLAKRIVVSSDVFHPTEGKIGLEFEFSKPEDPLEQPISDVWEEGVDNPQSNPEGTNAPEMRRSINALHYNAEYIRSVSHLSDWFRDNAQHLSSMHIHLDKTTHPVRPDLGGILGNSNRTYRNGINYNTMEIRGLLVPFDTRQRNRLDGAAVVSAIELYIAAAREDEHFRPEIHLESDRDYTWDQLTFAYVSAHLDGLEGRLALLKVLEHPLMFKSIDPYSLIQGFDDASKPIALKTLEKSAEGNYQKLALVRAMYEAPGIFLPNIIEYLQGENEQSEKEYLVRAITSQPTEFTETIDQLATFQDHYVRAAVAKFWATDPSKYREKLENIYASDPSWRVRAEVVNGWVKDLGKNQNKLKEIMQDKDPYIRKLVVKAWLEKPNLFRDDILNAYKNQGDSIRNVIVDFWAMRPRSYKDELKLASQDSDQDIRERAERAVAASN